MAAAFSALPVSLFSMFVIHQVKQANSHRLYRLHEFT